MWQPTDQYTQAVYVFAPNVFGENIPSDEFGMNGVNTGMTGVNTGSSTARGEYLRVHVQALTGLTIGSRTNGVNIGYKTDSGEYMI